MKKKTHQTMFLDEQWDMFVHDFYDQNMYGICPTSN